MQTVSASRAQGRSLMGWRPLRGLLRLDVPVAARSEEEVEAEVWQNYRWNFSVNLLDVAFFWLGLSFASSSTILPLFVSKLWDSPLLIGLLAMLGQAGWFLPQLLTAGHIERSARKKPWVVNLGMFAERVPVAIWPLAALTATVSPGAALILFFASYAWHQVGAGLIAPAWQDMIAVCFPVTRRGRFMGLSFFVGTGVGTVGAFFSGQILEAFTFPHNFALLFALTTGGILVSWVFIALTREPVQPVDAQSLIDTNLRGKLGRILRQDHNFRRYLLARMLISMGAMGTGFVAVAVVDLYGVPDRTVGYFTAILMVGQTLGNLVCGLLSDRYGHKHSMELSVAALAAAFALAWIAPSPAWYYGVFLLLGFFNAGTMVSGLLIVMEFTDRSRRPTYVGVANTAVGIANLVAPLIGGWIALMGYDSLFLLSAVGGCLGLLLLRFWVLDPRYKTVAERTAVP